MLQAELSVVAALMPPAYLDVALMRPAMSEALSLVRFFYGLLLRVRMRPTARLLPLNRCQPMLLRLVLLLAVLYFRTPTATCCVDSLDGAVFECPVMLI